MQYTLKLLKGIAVQLRTIKIWIIRKLLRLFLWPTCLQNVLSFMCVLLTLYTSVSEFMIIKCQHQWLTIKCAYNRSDVPSYCPGWCSIHDLPNIFLILPITDFHFTLVLCLVKDPGVSVFLDHFPLHGRVLSYTQIRHNIMTTCTIYSTEGWIMGWFEWLMYQAAT